GRHLAHLEGLRELRVDAAVDDGEHEPAAVRLDDGAERRVQPGGDELDDDGHPCGELEHALERRVARLDDERGSGRALTSGGTGRFGGAADEGGEVDGATQVGGRQICHGVYATSLAATRPCAKPSTRTVGSVAVAGGT